MHSGGGDFRAAMKLEHERGVPPRGQRECLGDDECAATKTEKQNHKKARMIPSAKTLTAHAGGFDLVFTVPKP